jgi:hypothetical protein
VDVPMTGLAPSCRIVHDAQTLVISDVEFYAQGGLLDPRTPSTFKVGDLRRPMKTYLYLRRHPALLYAIPISALALAFLLGRVSAPSKKERT